MALKLAVGRDMLLALAAAFAITMFTTVAHAQTTPACGNEPQIARDRAQRLDAAAASCRQDLTNPDNKWCHVRVSWKDDARISASEAEALAASLRKYADQMDAIDQQLDKSNSEFDVVGRGTYVSKGKLRCAADTSASTEGDKVTQCRLDCYQKFGVPYQQCWNEDIRAMGLCMANNGLSLKGCSQGCEQ